MRLILVIIIVIILFYSGYYIINLSVEGKEIADALRVPYPAVIAHRGASKVAPESTVPAFVQARDSGSDYLEADLQRTKDGRIVIFHDLNLKDKSNIKEIFPDRQNQGIESFTYDELQQLDLGKWFNKSNSSCAKQEYQGLSILTLEDLIRIAREGDHTPGLALETKAVDKSPGIEEDVVRILNREGWIQDNQKREFANTIFFSFREESLKKFKELAVEIPRVLLITENMITRRRWTKWIERAEGLADGLGAKGFMCWPWYIATAQERGLFVFPYTINELWQIKILAYLQSSGYITDRPDLALEFLDRISNN